MLRICIFNMFVDSIYAVGYNLGTSVLKTYKWMTKPYQNDSILKEKEV